MKKISSKPIRTKLLTLSIFTLLIVVLAFTPSSLGVLSARQTSNLADVNVAVYGGGHSTGNLASRTALIHMFEWMGASVTEVSPDAIVNGDLVVFDMLVMPAISPYTLRDEMTSICYDIIRDYVAAGGAFFCITGGTYFEWDFFELFDVILQGRLLDLPVGKNLLTININKDSTGPDLSAEPDSYSTLVWTGSYFDAPSMSEINVIARYDQNDLPCMVTFEYGDGTVFLSSPHPENEEGNPRDGTDYEDELDDSDSEWNLLLIISQWLLDFAGGPAPNPFSVGIIIIGIVAVVVVVVGGVGILFMRRRIAT
ncbi:MAG: hypothetical protein ACFE8O_03275 [Candidatus Hermodarchaeota archaeon]